MALSVWRTWRGCARRQRDSNRAEHSGHTLDFLVLWIRIRIRIHKDPHQFGNLDPHPDPHPHQIKIPIRIKNFKLDPEPDPDPHRFSSQNERNMSLF
jgi:hypothetical protein